MGRTGAEPVQELVAVSPPRCSLPMGLRADRMLVLLLT
jgi:hypothetical protein